MNLPSASSDTIDEILLQACQTARIADDLRAQNVVVIDLRGITSICDFFVIGTGSSTRQMRAIAEEVNKAFKREAWPTHSIEGNQDAHWILADYGDIVLHVFGHEARELYDLEGLWADADRIDWHAVLGIEQDRGL